MGWLSSFNRRGRIPSWRRKPSRRTGREAILFSVGANATHGIRRTNADKRNAVLKLLGDPEWGQWSDSQIAKICGVSHAFVGEMRASHLKPLQVTKRKIVNKHGQTTTINTANIGKTSKSQNEESPPVASGDSGTGPPDSGEASEADPTESSPPSDTKATFVRLMLDEASRAFVRSMRDEAGRNASVITCRPWATLSVGQTTRPGLRNPRLRPAHPAG
jgi:hypothetical protein